MPTLSIIICTRNRADSLRETLASIGRCRVSPDLTAELVVVDNGSSDHTRAVVQAANLKNMPVRYVFESRRGISHARNRGLAESAGDIVLFTDDDVCPPTNWIDCLCRPITRGWADAVVGGIRIPPYLRKRWLTEAFPAFVACREPLDEDTPEFLVGANMAFARPVLDRVPGFDVELGPGALGFGDESLFSLQLREAGYRIAAVRDADVEHHFNRKRLRPGAILETARRMGRSEAYIFYHWEHKKLWQWNWVSTLRKTLALSWRRLCRHREWACQDVPSYWAIPAVTAYAFVRQFLREFRRQRQYDRRGLVKKSVTGHEVAVVEHMETRVACREQSR